MAVDDAPRRDAETHPVKLAVLLDHIVRVQPGRHFIHRLPNELHHAAVGAACDDPRSRGADEMVMRPSMKASFCSFFSPSSLAPPVTEMMTDG